MKKCVEMSGGLQNDAIIARAARDIKHDVLYLMVKAGVDLTAENGVNFIEDVAAARKACELLWPRMVAEAKAHGYDPTVHGKLTYNQSTGTISWETPDEAATDDVPNLGTADGETEADGTAGAADVSDTTNGGGTTNGADYLQDEAAV